MANRARHTPLLEHWLHSGSRACWGVFAVMWPAEETDLPLSGLGGIYEVPPISCDLPSAASSDLIVLFSACEEDAISTATITGQDDTDTTRVVCCRRRYASDSALCNRPTCSARACAASCTPGQAATQQRNASGVARYWLVAAHGALHMRRSPVKPTSNDPRRPE